MEEKAFSCEIFINGTYTDVNSCNIEMYYCLDHCKNRKDERKACSGWDVD